MRTIALAIAGAMTCGCSFVFVSGPPDHPEKLPPQMPLDCTTSRAAPILDGVFAGYETFRTTYALTRKESEYRDFPISRGADIGIGIGLTALFVVSMAYGFTATNDCEDAIDARLRRGPPEGLPPPSIAPGRVPFAAPPSAPVPTPPPAQQVQPPAPASPPPSTSAPQLAPTPAPSSGVPQTTPPGASTGAFPPP
jgi:hypothetical protein